MLKCDIIHLTSTGRSLPSENHIFEKFYFSILYPTPSAFEFYQLLYEIDTKQCMTVFVITFFFRPIGSIVGAVIGSLVGLASLIGLIVFFCCIRPRRLAAAGHVIHTPGNNVAVVSATGWFQTLHLILLLQKFTFYVKKFPFT